MGVIEQAASQSGTPANVKIIETFLPSNLRAPHHKSPYAAARSAFPMMIDQKSEIVPRATMISIVAIEAMMKLDPHKASATILRCSSHESNKRPPARTGVKTV